MKKRYIIIPLIIMGLILLVSPFIIRVNAEEVEERSIGNNTSTYNTAISFQNPSLSANQRYAEIYICFTNNFYNFLLGSTNDIFHIMNGTSVLNAPMPDNNTNGLFKLYVSGGYLHYYWRTSINDTYIDVNTNVLISVNTRIYIQPQTTLYDLFILIYDGDTYKYTIDLTFSVNVIRADINSSAMYSRQTCNPADVVFDINNFPPIAPITNIISYPSIQHAQNNYYYFKELTRIWDDTYNNDEYVELVNFIDSLDNEYIIRLYRPLPNERSVITRDTYLQLYDDTNNIMYYNKLYDKEESFNIYYDDYNGYIHFYHMRQNILNGNVQFVEYDHIYNFTGTRKLSSISCELENVSSASFTDFRVLTGSDINEEVLLYTLNRIVSNWDTVYNNGYNAGYTAGQAGENSISPFVNIITTVFTGIDSVLQIEMLPHIKLWYFIAIPLTFVILWGVFKIFKSH